MSAWSERGVPWTIPTEPWHEAEDAAMLRDAVAEAQRRVESWQADHDRIRMHMHEYTKQLAAVFGQAHWCSMCDPSEGAKQTALVVEPGTSRYEWIDKYTRAGTIIDATTHGRDATPVITTM